MYTNRIVAFIDIMGFKELIFDPSTDFKTVNDLLEQFSKGINSADNHFAFRMEMAKSKLDPPKDNMIHSDSNKENVTFASDCVIWSFEIDDLKVKFEVFLLFLLSFLHLIQINFYYRGIVIRGGITIGKLYQKGNKVFGEGLVKAYLLERMAKYPRIVFDKAVIDKANKSFVTNYLSHQLTFEKRRDIYFFDLCKYYSYITGFSEGQDHEGKQITQELISTYVRELSTVIVNGLRHKKFKVQAKYFWLYKQLSKYPNLKPMIYEERLFHISIIVRLILSAYLIPNPILVLKRFLANNTP